MSQRNMSFVFADPSRVSRYLFSLYFYLYLQRRCTAANMWLSATSLNKNLLSKINIPRHSPPVIAGLLPADPAGRGNRSTVIARRRNPAAVSISGGDGGRFHRRLSRPPGR
jgi:hypothetical protein